ncbi:MAG TPA: RHS repeat-associated core domain-containing protein, partial [Rhodanobacteraceae bacterium]|nr:RHS repeat-associated core domain-containing protein [Rhodanobacteraceae bacterium]
DPTGIAEIPGYTGAAPDSETGITYLGARYLWAERFLAPDPAPLDPTNPMGLNRYAYANDNPARYTDPDGRQAFQIMPSDSTGARAWQNAAVLSQATRNEEQARAFASKSIVAGAREAVSDNASIKLIGVTGKGNGLVAEKVVIGKGRDSLTYSPSMTGNFAGVMLDVSLPSIDLSSTFKASSPVSFESSGAIGRGGAIGWAVNVSPDGVVQPSISIGLGLGAYKEYSPIDLKIDVHN